MMRLSRISEWTGGVLRGADRDISAVSTDTRRLSAGTLFVALRGERFDGHAFLEQAREAGAVAALVETDQDVFESQVTVADSRRGLGLLAAGYAAGFAIPRVAVTGNAGKTTVKEMIAALLGEGTLATLGNLNNDIGVPLTLLRFDDQVRQAVIELGANAPGEIAWTSSLVRPRVVLITNVTGAHLEGFGTMEGIARAKAEIFSGCAAGATAVINNADGFADFFAGEAAKRGLNVVRVGGADGALRAEEVVLEDAEVRFRLMPQGLPVRVPLAGAHQVENALLALAAVSALGVELADVIGRWQSLSPVPGRMNLKKLGSGLLVDDTYNANPGSVRAAVRWLADRPAPRTLVLGALGELGPGAGDIMRSLGEEASRDLDVLIAMPGAEAAAAGFGEGAVLAADHDDAAAHAGTVLDAGGTVLVKGSRTARMELVVHRLEELKGGH
ncbi:UDP-N-acetylmuramoyl-tripeptide--D-alanyl-D-alan ine ligase [Alcanivorax balearicus MACL04]|uniref:UDP-N-acetylmuramoyl-tripeptide--D-alanyl-D-alanine ligase n=1 Tax=Alloalcanivorax balearicus MACL04 TaxID=1177182 RepID=A0ABT2QWG7_9GAMM|nr:UDP-N-acetylmuramoyl-tripeptide--D-alanyl-D-alanine ligase [Alloalcanivorax balearicus]MCU5781869.1 UDP-N-acetylmuramoyl-tripeptide--D-alanyl-D-alan ine ligase [Alloalcanivorax balearicus MACL04]